MGVPAQICTTPTGSHTKRSFPAFVLAKLLQEKLKVENGKIHLGGENPVDRSELSKYQKEFILGALKDFYPRYLSPDAPVQRSLLDNLKLNHCEYLFVSNYLLKEACEAAQKQIGMAGADGSSPNPGSYEKLVGSLHRVLAEKYVPFDFVNGYKNGYMQGLLDKGALAEVCRLEKPEKVQMFLDAALNEWHESSRILEGMGDEIAKRDQAINLFAHSSMCVFKLLNAAKEEVKALQV